MTQQPLSPVEQLEQQLAALQKRVAQLEAQNQRRTLFARISQRPVAALAFAAVVALSGTVAFAASGNCPNGMPYCFSANTPAVASEINMNFAQLKEWLEQKVGTSGSANITITGSTTMAAVSNTGAHVSFGESRIQQGGTSNASAAAGKGLFVSSSSADGIGNTGGIAEFRHDNLTQGVGIGYNTIYATGSATNQDIGLKAAGNGNIQLRSNTAVTGSLQATGRIVLKQDSCAWYRGPWWTDDSSYHTTTCPVGAYMAAWQCKANNYLDGDCGAYCCYP